MKFKIFDKVRVIKDIGLDGEYLGEIGVIIEVCDNDYRVSFEDQEWWYAKDEEVGPA